jgi:hypothetical protein
MSRWLLTLSLCLVASPVFAQTPRVAVALHGLERAPAVLIAPDRAWVAPTTAQPTIVCTAALCRPVVRVEECTTPRCPGAGLLVHAAERVADVSDWPTDYEGYTRELDVLRVTPELAPLFAYFTAHPSSPAPPSPPWPARFSASGEEWWHLELTALGGVATGLVHISEPMWHAQLELGITFRPQEVPDEGLDVIYGTQLGAELRAHVIGNVSGQRPDDLAIFVGVAPIFAFVDYDDVFRIPPAFSWIAPEVGLVVRTDGRAQPSWYVGWSLPASVLLDSHLGIEARTSLLFIDDWYSGDDAEVLVTLDVGLVLR